MTIRIDGTNTAANPGITGSDTDTGLQFGTDEVNIVTGGTTRAKVDDSGRLLIGKTDTDHLSDSTLILEGTGASADGNPTISFSRNKTIGSATALGMISFGKDDHQGARIYGMSNGTWTEGSAHPSDIYFDTVPNSSTTLTTQAKILKGGELQFNSGYGSVATAYGVRAWINFNGNAGTIGTGNASANMDAVTDNGDGDYTLNFTNDMPDANYAVTGACSGDTPTDPHQYSGHIGVVHNGFAVGSCRIVVTRNQTGGENDIAWNSDKICIAFIR